MSEEARRKAGVGRGSSSQAPAEIGELVRAVDTGEGMVSFALQLKHAGLLVGVSAFVGFVLSIIPGAILVWVLTDLLGVERETARLVAKGLVALVTFGAAAIAAPAAWGVNAPASRTYIGREGVARLERRGKGAGPRVLMRFEEARQLVRTTRKDAAIQGKLHSPTLHFDYQWLSASGATLLRLHGAYYRADKGGLLVPGEDAKAHALAEEIERAWNDFLLRRARAAIEAGEVVEVVRDVQDRSRRARIGRGFVTMIDGARIERWDAQEIGSLALEGGTVTILRRDPLRGRDQEHSYPGGVVENESFFPLALREIAGVYVEEAPRVRV
jgi:hypothetical protein